MPTSTAPSAQTILDDLKRLGSEGYRKILLNHGTREPVYGVKIEELKKIQKRVGKDHALGLELFESGVYDAMYLAGMMVDAGKMTKKDLQRWVKRAGSPAIAEYTVSWVAAESPDGQAAALEWIESKDEDVAAAGWATLAGIVATKADSELDLEEIRGLVERIATTIHDEPDHVRYMMNSFIIAVGSYVKPLSGEALAAAKRIGKVSVDMGETACKVPDAAAYINKVKARGAIGKKRKSAAC